MWLIRVLSGPQAGQSFRLRSGSNLVGRAPNCDIKILSPGISKEHAKIEVLGNKVVVTDMGSRNGTFVNGVQVLSQMVSMGDKIALHDVFIDIMPEQSASHVTSIAHHRSSRGAAAYDGNVAYHQHPPEMHAHHGEAHEPGMQVVPQGLAGLQQVVRNYLENVVLPGIYKLAEWMDLKVILATFLGCFIIFVTALSTIPLVRILKTSIERESQRRAMTIAKTLATVNRAPLMQGIESSVSVEIAQREPGVDQAFILSNIDGNIIAPANKAGQYPNIPFVHSARKEAKEVVAQIDHNTIGASVPIEFFNANTGTQSVSAYAVVIYNMGSLAVDDGQTISLFIQTLFIALIVGGVLFFFMYKLIEFPFNQLNRQIDEAMKTGNPLLEVNYQFAPLQTLISNFNSSLNRALAGNESAAQLSEADRSKEIEHVVQLIGFGAMAITAHDRRVAAMNPAFEERTGLSSANLVYSPLDSMTDQALRLSIMDLIEKMTLQPDQMPTNQIEFGGQNFEIAGQAIMGSKDVAYFVLVLLPAEEGG